MLISKINICDISDTEYAEIERLFPTVAKKVKNSRPDKRKQTLAGRLLLKRLVKDFCGKDDFSVLSGENGKPMTDCCCFSIAHSGEYAVCAVSDKPVGVDIEAVGVFKKREKYMLFTPLESKYVNKADSAVRFYSLWTMKEAYIKALGGSLPDVTGTELVTKELKLKKSLSDYIFTTEKEQGYILTVCERLRSDYTDKE